MKCTDFPSRSNRPLEMTSSECVWNWLSIRSCIDLSYRNPNNKDRDDLVGQSTRNQYFIHSIFVSKTLSITVSDESGSHA